jgi:hypothetical protein
MSSEVVRELFRNLEITLHDRLKVIEDILSLAKNNNTQTATQTQTTPEVTSKLQQLEHHIASLDEYAMSQVRALAYNHDMLEKRVESMESAVKSAIESFKTINETIGMMQKRIDDEKPVEAAEVEAEIKETEEAALEEEWCEHEQPKYKNGLECSACIEEKEEQVEEEEAAVEEEEEAVEEEEEAVEEEEQVEEEEEAVEEELEFEEFTAKRGKKTRTYHRDQHNNVYLADEEGCIDPNEVLGIYSPKTKEVTWNS